MNDKNNDILANKMNAFELTSANGQLLGSAWAAKSIEMLAVYIVVNTYFKITVVYSNTSAIR